VNLEDRIAVTILVVVVLAFVLSVVFGPRGGDDE
jgi:hypothetical protein